ncbi:mannosyl-oligosaccharide glucosidase GCS1 [Capsicum annuum]|uniref:mannosyl-oligosaccharide glucosidase GCS1 n=1 Tax=Capsicum annuum TaxID=4072 RepID=UPI0007BEF636|nr:mannosyl-oligosaccharide glucosidase GCS1 [Capsicum annuum]XP_016547966.2 mannosyl-oligosaccharide glucosidase GCS1 [Capsicum annuum]XP_047254760.1 mannosyl-oligosaccharide glucosidase GCS1 [Capsicum annuum]
MEVEVYSLRNQWKNSSKLKATDRFTETSGSTDLENSGDWKQLPKARVLMRSPRKTCSTTGYVSLFPFILSLIPPDSWILESQLDLISNRSILWTNFRLRSLSKTSSMYMKRNTEHDPPYWRGPIWTPLNYLIVSYLHHYTQEPKPSTMN